MISTDSAVGGATLRELLITGQRTGDAALQFSFSRCENFLARIDCLEGKEKEKLIGTLS